MKKYGVLLFDADDTLLDFHTAERNAASMLFGSCGVDVSEELLEDYSNHNLSLWKRLEKKEITREELFKTRFVEFFKKHGINSDGVLANETYIDLLSRQTMCVEGAEEILRYFYKKIPMYIVSNGQKRVQEGRFKNSILSKYIEFAFISEYAGYNKPDRRFFDYVFSNIPYMPDEALIIGDSISADIKGGANYGVDTCYFNIKNTQNESAVEPTYTINKLEELKEIVEI